MAHRPATELIQLLAETKTKVEIGATYFHYKHPEQLYTLVDVIIIEATEEIGVCYRAEYPELQGVTFMRPISDFLTTVENDGQQVSRFTKVTS